MNTLEDLQQTETILENVAECLESMKEDITPHGMITFEAYTKTLNHMYSSLIEIAKVIKEVQGDINNK